MAADRVAARRTALVLLGVSVVPAIVFVAMWLPDRRLANGPHATAEIVEVLSVRGPQRRRDVIPRTSRLRVRFETAESRDVTTTVRTTARDFGTTFEITYDPADPTSVRAVDGPERAWRVPAIVAATLAGLGLYAAWTALRLANGRPSRLYRRTTATRGEPSIRR